MSDYDDWQKLEAVKDLEKMEMIIHRCTMGVNGNDGQYSIRAKQAESLQLMWGSYHFCRFEAPNPHGTASEDPDTQAKHYLTTLRKIHAERGTPKHTLLVLDWLSYGKKDDKLMTASALAEMITSIRNHSGAAVGICTSPSVINHVFADQNLSRETIETIKSCWLWLMKEGREPPTKAEIGPWDEWTLWMTYTTDNARKEDQNISRNGDFSWSRMTRGPQLNTWYESTAWNLELVEPFQ